MRLTEGTRWAVMSIGCFLAFATMVVTELRLLKTSFAVMVPTVAVFLAVLVVGAARHGIGRPPRLAVTTTAAFCLLIGYATVSALLTTQRIGGGDVALITLSKVWTLQVLGQALGVCLMAFLAVALVRQRDLPVVAWWFAMAGAVVTPLGWLINHDAPGGRLATRVGGAAVLHVALLLGLAVSYAAWRSRHRPRLSLAAALAYAAYIFLSQSRAGVITLVLFVVLLVGSRLVRGRKDIPRRVWVAAGAGVAALGVLVAFVFNRRSYDPFGGGRMEAWAAGWAAVSSSARTLLLGTGYGTLWPWYAFEQGQYQSDVRAVKTMPHGETLAHAHNVYVSVGAELGLVGLALLLPVLVAVGWSFLRATTRQSKAIAAALAASLAGFFFDTYLIKNFALSLIWWLALFTVIRLNQPPPQPAPEPAPRP